jgi:hypothetical protein
MPGQPQPVAPAEAPLLKDGLYAEQETCLTGASGYAYYPEKEQETPLAARDALLANIASAREEASAEKSFGILRPKVQNPWRGAAKRLAGAEKALVEHDEHVEARAFEAVLVQYEGIYGNPQAADDLRVRQLEVWTQKHSLSLVRKDASGNEVTFSVDDLFRRGAHTRSGPYYSEDDRAERDLVTKYAQLDDEDNMLTAAIANLVDRRTFEGQRPVFATYGAQLDAQQHA